MTSTLIILGDSLVDSGNTASLLSPIGQNPFADAIYDKGGNVKASDGPVLGEHVALELGADINNSQLISVLSADDPAAAQIHNYAHAGARTGAQPGFSIPLLGSISIGLQDQVRQVKARHGFYLESDDIDVLLSCGGNDLLDVMDRAEDIQAVVMTESLEDDRALAKEMVQPIAKNIKYSIRKLDDFVDEIAVLGAPPIVETPEAQEWITNFASEDQAAVSNFLVMASDKLQYKLEKKYDDQMKIAVIDSDQLWQQLDQPGFVDSIHPDSNTSSALAELFGEEISATLETYAFV